MSRYSFLALLILSAAMPAAAQTVSPPLVEYQERASASFQVSNPTLFPQTVVLQPRGFEVDERGNLRDTPLDTSRIRLKLSAMSVRLAPRQTYTVFYEVEADSAPAWFAIMSVFTGGRTQNGIAVRVELPHVVYLNQRAPIAQADVRIAEFRHDAVGKRVWLKVENTGRSLGRIREGSVTGGNRTEQVGSVPIFPGARRWVSVAWQHPEPPQRASLRFDGFRLETQQPPVPGAVEAPTGS